VLERTLRKSYFNPQLFERRYVPNLLGIPFELAQSFVTRLHQQTQSPYVKTILQNWVGHLFVVDWERCVAYRFFNRFMCRVT
jgi:hypothetical protein